MIDNLKGHVINNDVHSVASPTFLYALHEKFRERL